MDDQHNHLSQGETLPRELPVCPEPGQGLASPLGWSVKGRLLCAAGAAALLWLAVAWANGWMS